MQRLRVCFATALLMVSGVAVFGRKALASPSTAVGLAPPQACSANTSTGGTGGGSSGGLYITFSGGTGTGSGGDNGTGGTGGDDSDHVAKTPHR